MSPTTANRVVSNLEKIYGEHIDMRDCEKKSSEERKDRFMSRALAALAVQHLSGCSTEVAATSVTDDFTDCGVDAVFLDHVSDRFFMVQSQYSRNANKGVGASKTNEFVRGVRRILNGEIDYAEDTKLAKKGGDIEQMRNGPQDIKLVLVLVQNATGPVPPDSVGRVETVIAELNESDPSVASSEYFSQDRVIEAIRQNIAPKEIDLEVPLEQFGRIDAPFKAYYGRVNINTVKAWWDAYQTRLCARNLRFLLGLNEPVNQALATTLLSEPEFFWYFNNGITIICDRIQVTPGAAANPKAGIIHAIKASIVNGAQTVGVIGSRIPALLSANLSDCWVHVRIVELAYCPPDFDKRISRANNFQNSVIHRDFVSLDPVQHELARQFALDGRTYAFKNSGDPDPQGDEGCSLSEATQALACAQPDITYTVDLKREAGTMWADPSVPPYTTLFNQTTTGPAVWRAVQVLRAVDAELLLAKRGGDPRARKVASHLNRVMLYMVFRVLTNEGINYQSESDADDIAARARFIAKDLWLKLMAQSEATRPELLAGMAKNKDASNRLAIKVMSSDLPLGHAQPQKLPLGGR